MPEIMEANQDFSWMVSLKASINTTGYVGGDSSDTEVRIILPDRDSGLFDIIRDESEVTFITHGDGELESLLVMFEWIADTLGTMVAGELYREEVKRFLDQL